MSLNIKKARVHELAREPARRTGRIAADFAARLTDEDRPALSTEWLYDENGLPG